MTVKEAASPTKRGRIMWDPTNCSGCRACEVVCSLTHEGVVNPQLSRIRIATWEYEAWRSEAYVCKQCKAAECMEACPTSAITHDVKSGGLVIDESLCTGCQACLEACPATPSRILFNETKGVCAKCDLCGGDPQCVTSCQQAALRYERGQ